MAGLNPRIWSAEEADRTLPLVGAIVGDAMEKWKQLEAAKRALRKTSARLQKVDAAAPPSESDRRLKNDIRDLEREIEEHKAELEEIGCYLKDPEKGLVDFPAFVGSELVYLCWSPGEIRVSHYHGVRESFIARKPIPPEGTTPRAQRLENETAS
jgi:hypothetical protein